MPTFLSINIINVLYLAADVEACNDEVVRLAVVVGDDDVANGLLELPDGVGGAHLVVRAVHCRKHVPETQGYIYFFL